MLRPGSLPPKAIAPSRAVLDQARNVRRPQTLLISFPQALSPAIRFESLSLVAPCKLGWEFRASLGIWRVRRRRRYCADRCLLRSGGQIGSEPDKSGCLLGHSILLHAVLRHGYPRPCHLSTCRPWLMLPLAMLSLAMPLVSMPSFFMPSLDMSFDFMESLTGRTGGLGRGADCREGRQRGNARSNEDRFSHRRLLVEKSRSTLK